MIETPTQAEGSAAVTRARLGGELAEHARQIDAMRARIAEAEAIAGRLALAGDGGAGPGSGSRSTGVDGWRGLASRAFGVAARHLARELAVIDDRLLEGRQLVDAAEAEVGAGV